MNNKITITVGHIAIGILTLLIVYTFSTGWECGYDGDCEYPQSDVWQGVARLVLTILFGVGLVFLVVEYWSEGIEINNPFIRNKEAWEEYQQWLKERKR